MSRPLAIIVAIVLAIIAIGAVIVSRRGDDSRWVVSATVDDPQRVEAACGELPGIEEMSFSMTSDLPPGTPAGGVHWTVDSSEAAREVEECLLEHGATSPVIEPERPPKSFESTDS